MQRCFRQFSFFLILFLMLLCLVYSSGYSEGSFEVKRVGNIHPYEENAFRISSSESGEITICIHDGICIYRTLKERVTAGETTIKWDGCGFNKEKLYEKTYTITAEIVTDSGQRHSVSFQSPVEYAGQYLQYALPSSRILCLDSLQSWFLEYRTVTNGTVELTLTDNSKSEPGYIYRFTASGGKILRKDFASLAGKKGVPEPGDYTVSVYETSKPEEKKIFPLTILEHTPESLNVSVTGEIMPERTMSDQEIWEMMLRPSVVVDIDFFKHQDIYAEPDYASGSLGTVHGQTQGLKVISIEGSWALVGAWNHEEGEYVEGWVPLQNLKVETTQTEYGILIDKSAQTLTIYHDGKAIDTLLVSTGRAEKNSLYQETSAGSFLTGYHRVNFSTNGKKYDYVIQYDGGNLLHQTPYDWGQQKKDFTLGRGYLGTKASHACIRIQPEPGEGGLNAYWIFTHIPYHTRVIILDDADERRAIADKLKRKDSSPDYSVIHTVKTEEVPSEQTVRMTFGGMFIPGGTRTFNSRRDSFIAVINKEGYDSPMSGLKQYLSGDDLTCVNLGCFLETDNNPDEWKELEYAPKGMGQLFSASSIELVQITDDKLYNSGDEKIRSTISEINLFSHAVDRNHPYTVVVKGHLFGFAGCSESEYLKDPCIIDNRIHELRDRKCERIVFLISCKDDRSQNHSIVQEAMAHRCVRAGADLVVGNQQGYVQGIEYIDSVPVIYSTGSMLNGNNSGISKSVQGILVQAEFDFRQEEISVHIIPILPCSDNSKSKNDYHPSDRLSQSAFEKTILSIWNDSTLPAVDRVSFHICDS